MSAPGDWVTGALISNVWSVGGSGDQDVNFFLWYLVSAPIITSNWKASSGDKWTVPVGGGVGKIFRLGKMTPMNFSIQGYYNAVLPDVVGAWTLRTQLQ